MSPALAAAMITDTGRELRRVVRDLDEAQIRVAEEYVAYAQAGTDDDWTVYDLDSTRVLLTRINALARDLHFPAEKFERIRELLDAHIEQCAAIHARQCRRNGTL